MLDALGAAQELLQGVLMDSSLVRQKKDGLALDVWNLFVAYIRKLLQSVMTQTAKVARATAITYLIARRLVLDAILLPVLFILLAFLLGKHDFDFGLFVHLKLKNG